jgi:hypothetical protein
MKAIEDTLKASCLLDQMNDTIDEEGTYRVSHNTCDYKNAVGRPLNDNIENWEVFHFEAKYHTFQTRGVRLWCVEFFVKNFSKNQMTQNLDDFNYVVILPYF